ncbi:cytochrome P450 [Actinoalloteichus hymeniacidonis]|uniref:Cytochrome P450 n=2 Tax=Actinoalloteichus hymeniacidonis TaxID=340345 RepID=A0AAC9HRE8_9PSEU|nr:cytochrome P450 [Actinoalloteichus hymeniacidonis]
MIDLADPDTFLANDLTDFWRHLRHEQPVYRHPGTAQTGGFWVLSRHADLLAVYRDTEHFTSERGNMLDTLLHGGDSASGRMLVVTDGPRHRELRRVLLRAFAPRALRVVVERLQASVRRLVLDAARAGSVDFAADVASAIPLATICDLLAVPDVDRARILEWTSAAHGSENWLAVNEILTYFAGLARQRRDTPHSDVISLLATSEVDGKLLEEDEIILNCYSLILGGNETTRLSMIGGVLAFIENPEQWAALRDGLVEVDSAVEEVLRWTSPTMYMGRSVKSDVVLHDTEIKAGDVVTLWNIAANHDEAVFDQPERFDLARTPNNHLTFGHGQHFCLGAYLTRIELSTLFEVLRTAVADIALQGTPVRIHSTMLTGYSSLPVSLRPNPEGAARLAAPTTSD